LSIRPDITAVGRVTFSSGGGSFKSLIVWLLRVATKVRSADIGSGFYD
jgi:hypothetical protein